MTPAQIASATDAELHATMNAPRSDGEIILSEKSGEWARRYQETGDSADLAKALDCARASLTLYNERTAYRLCCVGWAVLSAASAHRSLAQIAALMSP